MTPWLITTSGWPVLAARFAGPAARLIVHPVIAGGVAATVLALAGGMVVALLRGRVRRPRPSGRST